MTGFRTWSTGDSVSAADFTSYIATQSVLIFSNASARSSAVTSPVDGMLSILTTDNVLSIYSSSAWVDVIDIDTLTVSSGNYTMSGSLTLTGGTPIVLEGATADAYETSIAVTDPTADRTITLPNATGTVVTTGNLTDITALGTLTGASPIVLEGATADGYETTIAVTDPTADRTITLPDATGTLSVTDGIGFSGSTANGVLTYHNSTTAAVESTAVYDATTLTLSASGGGLKMDGLNSTDANTLDDYEEGYWTCALTASTSGTITVNTGSDQGYYIKVGKLVHIQGYFTVSAVSSPAGTLRVGGLPFTTAASLNEHADRGSNCGTVLDLANAKSGIHTHVHANTTFMDMNAGAGGTSQDASLADDVDTGTSFLISGSYVANT